MADASHRRVGAWAAGFLLCLGLGAWGHHLADRTLDIADAIYEGIRLFGLNLDTNVRPLPWSLQLARFAAPLLTAAAFVRLLGERGVSTARAELARLLHRRTAIVIGFGLRGRAIAQALRSADRRLRLVAIDRDFDAVDRRVARTARIELFVADADDGRQMASRLIGLGRAEQIIVTCGGDAQSLNAAGVAAEAIAGAAGSAGDPRLWVDVADQRLLRRLRDRAGSSRIEPMSATEAMAIGLVADLQPAFLARDLGQARLHVILCGFGDCGWATIEQIVLQGRVPTAYTPPLVSVIDSAPDAAERWSAAHPELGRFAEVRFDCADMHHRSWSLGNDPLFAAIVARAPPTLVVFASGNANGNIAAALALRDAIGRGAAPRCAVAVRVRDAVPPELDEHGPDLADRLIAFGTVAQAARWLAAVQPAFEQLARALHADYQQNHGGGSFAQLPNSLRRSNMRGAMHLGPKLRALGFEGIDMADPCFGLSEGDLDRIDDLLPEALQSLALFEHIRWSNDRALDGWTLGEHDDVARTRPTLFGGADGHALMSAGDREKDERQVLAAFAALRQCVGPGAPRIARVVDQLFGASPVWHGSGAELALGFDEPVPDWRHLGAADERDALRLTIRIPDEPPLATGETPTARSEARRLAYARFVGTLPSSERLRFRLRRDVPHSGAWLPIGSVDGH